MFRALGMCTKLEARVFTVELAYHNNQVCHNSATKPFTQRRPQHCPATVKPSPKHYLVVVSPVGHSSSVIVPSVWVATSAWKDRATRIRVANCTAAATTATTTSATSLRHVASPPVVSTTIARDCREKGTHIKSLFGLQCFLWEDHCSEQEHNHVIETCSPVQNKDFNAKISSQAWS